MKAPFLKCIVNNTFLNLTRAAFMTKPNGLNLVKQFEINKPTLRFQSTSTYSVSNAYATDSKNSIPPPPPVDGAGESTGQLKSSSSVLSELSRKVPNSFALFMKQSFREEKAKNPALKATEVTTKLASVWRAMPYDQKSQYFKEADQLRKELKSEKTKILAEKSKEEVANLKKEMKEKIRERKKHLASFRIKRARNLSNKPKKPTNSFGLYLQSLDRGDASLIDFSKGASHKWKALAAEDKERFEVEAKKNMEKYKEEVKKWETRMLAEGKVELVSKAMKERMRRELKAAVPKKARVSKTKKKATKKLAKKVTKKAVRKSARKTAKKAAAPKKKITPTA